MHHESWFFGSVIYAALLAGLFALAGSVTACERSEFVCGERFGLQSEDVRRCDRVGERCVCATRRCAQPVPTTECSSGYKYVGRPFADGSCVEEADVSPGDKQHLADRNTGVCEVPDDDSASGAGGTSADDGTNGGEGGAE